MWVGFYVVFLYVTINTTWYTTTTIMGDHSKYDLRYTENLLYKFPCFYAYYGFTFSAP